MLLEALKLEAPCTAVVERKGEEITCSLTNIEHADQHCNDAVFLHVKEINPSLSRWERAVQKVKKKFNKLAHRQFPCKWPGAHEFADRLEPEEIRSIFENAFSKLVDATKSASAATRVDIVRRAFPMWKSFNIDDRSITKCIVCLGSHFDRSTDVDVRQLFCGHTFCSVCFDSFRESSTNVSTR